MAPLLELMRKATYKLVAEDEEMAMRKQYREETGKKNPRPNRSTEYFNISDDSKDKMLAVSHTASSSQFCSQLIEEPQIIESPSQHFAQVFFSC